MSFAEKALVDYYRLNNKHTWLLKLVLEIFISSNNFIPRQIEQR